MEQVMEWLNTPMFTISGVDVTGITTIFSGLVLTLGLLAAGVVRKVIIHRVGPRFNLEVGTAFTVGTLAFYALTALTFLIGLSVLGFKLGNLAIFAGALSVGIGFGLQNIASNFVSGLILLFDRSIKVNDYVELANGLRGTITQIRLRSTIIQTNDEIEVLVPNSQFLTDQVVNWTLSSGQRRIHVPFGVAYGSDVDHVRDVVLRVADAMPHTVRKQARHQPAVWFMEMAESSLNFELVVWVEGDHTKRPRGTNSEFLYAIHNALVSGGIEIPFPQRDIHIKQWPERHGPLSLPDETPST